jgi:hypothetical protein
MVETVGLTRYSRRTVSSIIGFCMPNEIQTLGVARECNHTRSYDFISGGCWVRSRNREGGGESFPQAEQSVSHGELENCENYVNPFRMKPVSKW